MNDISVKCKAVRQANSWRSQRHEEGNNGGKEEPKTSGEAGGGGGGVERERETEQQMSWMIIILAIDTRAKQIKTQKKNMEISALSWMY